MPPDDLTDTISSSSPARPIEVGNRVIFVRRVAVTFFPWRLSQCPVLDLLPATECPPRRSCPGVLVFFPQSEHPPGAYCGCSYCCGVKPTLKHKARNTLSLGVLRNFGQFVILWILPSCSTVNWDWGLLRVFKQLTEQVQKKTFSCGLNGNLKSADGNIYKSKNQI